MSLKVTERETITRTVTLLWPKPDTRVPEAQREPIILDGTLDCDFVCQSQVDAEKLDKQVEDGVLSHNERFAKICVDIRGLPLETGQTAHQWMDQSKYGAVVRAAIWEDYLASLGDARQGNSKKRR